MDSEKGDESMSSPRGRILLVDDDFVFEKVFANELIRLGYCVEQGHGKNVLEIIENESIDIAIIDIVMPEINGLDLLRAIKGRFPSLDVIMLTGNATIENAISSMKEGAYDYFTKPVELDRVEQVIERCLEGRHLREKNRILKNKVSDLREGRLIGTSPGITEIKKLIGRSGTGKELVANLIHMNSQRREEPFLVVDCTALNENLLESELFGHERGAFTDAVTKKHGIFEVADGGTVFLDEIGDLPLTLQAKLLRVVETKAFRPVHKCHQSRSSGYGRQGRVQRRLVLPFECYLHYYAPPS
jgi:DNA-binding NtrC family response regulator